MEQLYLQLRGSVFAEAGFCLNLHEFIPEGRLQRKHCAFFCVLDANGHKARLEKIVGTEGDAGRDDEIISVPLTPYHLPEKAVLLLGLACCNLEAALAGDRKAKETLADAWCLLVVQGCGVLYRDAKTQLDLLCNLFGRGRVLDELNHRGTVGGLVNLDAVAMVDEALNLRMLTA